MSVEIPLRSRAGVVGYALVDDEDAELVQRHRWYKVPAGYVVTRVPHQGGRYRTLYLHRLILGLDFGDRRQGDHKNFDKRDNRRENLRICTGSENTQHVPPRRGGSSRYRGVSFDRQIGLWRATVHIRGRQAFYASFDNELEAARAAAQFRAKHMPFSIEDPSLLEAA